jgi:hypothetical protein
MLVGFTKVLRIRAALALALLYSICVLMPTAALAFGDAAKAANCLTDNHHYAAAKSHVHGAEGHHQFDNDKSAHHPPADSRDKAPAAGACCGLICLSAIPAALSVVGNEPVRSPPKLAVLQQTVAGCGPKLLYRPPDFSLSL